MATKTLYVGNLPYGATVDELKDLFGRWGTPSDVRLFAEKGFAFVDIEEEHAAEAMSAVNGQDFKGRALRVSEARARSERRGGGGGGGGGDDRGWRPRSPQRRGPRW